jgi:hypothetical protein
LIDVRRVRLRIVCIGLIALSACTRQIEVPAVQPSKDFSGLDANERKLRPNWAAFDVLVPASVARSIRRWQLSNVTLKVFRCDRPDDAYPSEATLNGKPFHYNNLQEPLSPSTRLTFYVPLDQGRREGAACAALDARGHSPIFLRGQTVRLPPIQMTFPHYDEKTGRITAT